MKKLNAFLIAVLSFTQIFPTPAFPNAPVGGAPAAVDLRERLSECAIYLCKPYGDVYVNLEGKERRFMRTNSSKGVKVAEATPEAFAQFLEVNNRDLKDHVIVIAGAPMFSKSHKALKKQIKQQMKKAGFANVPVKLVTQPTGVGLQRMFEEFVKLFPQTTDFRPVLKYDVYGAIVTSSVAAATISVSFLLGRGINGWQEGRAVIANFGLDMGIAAGRGGLLNWNTRSPETPVGRFEKYMKDAVIGTMFATLFYVNPHVGEIGTWWTQGHDGYVAAHEFFKWFFTMAVLVPINSFALGNYFNGLGLWMRDLEDKGKEIVAARAVPMLNAALFSVSAPIFAWMPSESAPKLFTIPGSLIHAVDIDINLAHGLMLGLGTATFALYRNWKLFDHAVPPIERGIYGTGRQIGNAFRNLIQWIKPTVRLDPDVIVQVDESGEEQADTLQRTGND